MNRKPIVSSCDSPSQLNFNNITPAAPRGLAGLVRDHFAHGRLFATVGAHGGLLKISYWGNQHLGAPHFFKGDSESAWVKLMRVCVRIGDKSHYLTLNNTQLFPFGYKSRCEIAGISFEHELLLLRDTLVLRARVLKNPRRLPLRFEMVHQEATTAITMNHRTWEAFAFDEKHNALTVSCRDENPRHAGPPEANDGSLAQLGLTLKTQDAPVATTWIGLSCDAKFSVRRGYHARSKYYLTSDPMHGNQVAYYMTFATEESALHQRLSQLQKSIHEECDAQLKHYEKQLKNRPRIDVGDRLLNSAFGQYPEIIESLKMPDRAGAVRATASGYFVWGWDGMTPMIPCALANEPEYAADIFRFFQETIDPIHGLPHQFTTTFNTALKSSFPAQCQYIASLYHYVATTGDLNLVRDVLPTCKFILDHCKNDLVFDTGLVSGCALWPDFPEAMEEDGNDVSSMNNSLLYQALRSMEYLARAVNENVLANDCCDWAKKLRESFVKYFYDEEKGFFISSCSSKTLAPRKHYVPQSIYWITPFARELVSHAQNRIADFMQEHLRSDKCLLTLPHWDTAWMADGNQLGSSFPTADYFYLNANKLVGNADAIEAWLGDVDWFWQHHTAPEAFTPEAENEAALGPDNPGCKQLQAVTCWYASLYMGMAGMDFDHEGLTLTPWGNRPIDIQGLILHGKTIDLKIRGKGNHIGWLKLNGKRFSPGSRKIAWSDLKTKRVQIELVRSEKPLKNPVILRADGLLVSDVEITPSALTAHVKSDMSGELVVQTSPKAKVQINGQLVNAKYDSTTRCVTIPIACGSDVRVKIN